MAKNDEKAKPAPDYSEVTAAASKIDADPQTALRAAQVAASPEGDRRREPHVSPANTPGGSSPAEPSTGIGGPKDVEAKVKSGDTVLYRVHPLDDPAIKNVVGVEEADLLPATVLGKTSQGDSERHEVADLEITLPNGYVFPKNNVSRGAGSGQWRVGPAHFAVTDDHRPDAASHFSDTQLDAAAESEETPTGAVKEALAAQP